MADIYITTPTQADYDALMRLAEAAGYVWNGNEKPTQFNAWPRLEGGTVINLVGNKVYYEPLECLSSENCTIETIPNIADIKAIWNVSKSNWFAFGEEYREFKTQSGWCLQALNNSNAGCIILYQDNTVYVARDIEEEYTVLAVEYKPKESEDIMPEKVKLPKFMCTLIDISVNKKIATPELAYRVMDKLADESIEANKWLGKLENRWKLLNALHNGYEPEPEQLYYVRFIQNDSHSFLNSSESDGLEISDNEETEYIKTKFTMLEIIAIDPRYKAFAVKVEEVDGYEHE